jgi:hypothetical protein
LGEAEFIVGRQPGASYIRDYNGFSGSQRQRAQKWLNREWGAGRLAQPSKCLKENQRYPRGTSKFTTDDMFNWGARPNDRHFWRSDMSQDEAARRFWRDPRERGLE